MARRGKDPGGIDRRIPPGAPRRVALVTHRGLPGLDPDDRRLLPALEDEGLEAEPVVWDDRDVRWERYALAVIRSTWDSHLRRPEYLRWIARARKRTELWNRPVTLRWNTHKRYLGELARRGVPTVPTIRIRRYSDRRIDRVLSGTDWKQFVLKPAISADAYRTGRFHRHEAGPAQRLLETILPDSDALLQPYLRSVERSGERSLVFLGGRYSHAVAKPNLVHGSGGVLRARSIVATPAQRALARRALACAPERTLYARVDMLEDDGGRWRLLELELTEPSLYLAWASEAPGRLAAAIARRVPGRSR